jgi:hypothetical protein
MSVDAIVRAFETRLEQLSHDKAVWEALQSGDADLAERGVRAAEYAVAPFIWSRAVGDRFDTTELAEILSVSRQALASRVASGSLLALPGRGTRWYPSWQVDIAKREVRPVVAKVLAAWRALEPDVDPLVIATWATSPEDLLDDETPAMLIEAGGSNDRIVDAAGAVAGRRTG